jgi:hypothetical protein
MFQSLITTQTGMKHIQSLRNLEHYLSQALAGVLSQSTIDAVPPKRLVLSTVNQSSKSATVEMQHSEPSTRTPSVTSIGMNGAHLVVLLLGLVSFLLVNGFRNAAIAAL